MRSAFVCSIAPDCDGIRRAPTAISGHRQMWHPWEPYRSNTASCASERSISLSGRVVLRCCQRSLFSQKRAVPGSGAWELYRTAYCLTAKLAIIVLSLTGNAGMMEYECDILVVGSG